MAPLGILSIAAFLERRGHAVWVHDCLGPRAPLGAAANTDRVARYRPDLVGFSATTAGFLDAYAMAVRLKRVDPAITTVFGGVHVSSLGAPLLRHFPCIDYLCVGEGEATLAEVADGLAPGQIPGLVWRSGDGIVTNAPRPLLPDLDVLPFPAYEKLERFPGGYHLPLFSYTRTPGATMVTSRGCPYRCAYCDRSVFQRGFRCNSAAYVYAHLRYLRRRFGVRHVNFYDDLFTTQRPRVVELCRRLIARPLGMQFNCAVRVGHADDELLDLLKAAGFLQLSLGIETGNPDLMALHKPGVDLGEVRDTVRRIQVRGLRAKGLFMMGLPGETPATIRQTSDLVLSLDLDDMNMSKFTPFHGAPIWPQIPHLGRFDPDWRRMNCLNFVFVPHGVASRQLLDELYNRHVKRFYAGAAWRRRFARRLWDHRHSLWRLLRHWPAFLAAQRNFEPAKGPPLAGP
jgi:magnesium-protoporphyrin IX monomethyl ester (oxidative) cyclase